jgi:ABC-type iron transport system FetAB permease component
MMSAASWSSSSSRALAAIAAGAAVALVPVFTLVVTPHPWFEACHLVPIGGMMLASAMNVVAQVFERIFASSHAETAVIEQLLSLASSFSRRARSSAPFARDVG